MADSDLRNMIMSFRVSDLQVLLGFAGRNKTGKKQELQSRALDLVKLNSPAVEMKIKELHTRRYHHQLISRPSNYDIPDRTLTDRPLPNYESTMNNNYPVHCNPNVRPIPMNQGPTTSYPGKQYLPPVPPQSHFSPYADVKFKELPFYDILHVLMKPSSLIPDPIDRCQESTYPFTLSPQEAHDIAVSKDAFGNYECHILLRFCVLEPGTEQDDNFPPNISVKVNGKPVPLPNPIPTNRPGVEPKRPSKPVNITPYTKLSPTVTNVISVTWSSSYGRSYASMLYIARQLSSYTLLQRLKNRGMREPEKTTSMIIEKLQEDQDNDIATTSLQASLICPLGKLKMELPCRSLSCTHIPCFDAFLYIQLNEKKPKWHCPVCDKPALYKTLVIDGLFMEIVAKVPPECTDVQFHENGSWSPILSSKESKEVKKTAVEQTKNKSQAKSFEVVDISSDSDTEDVYKNPNNSDVPANPESPPVMFIPPDTNIIDPCPTLPLTSFTAPAETSHFSSNIQSDLQTSEPLSILPDLISNPENILPSTSSAELGSMSYPPYTSGTSSSSVNLSSSAFQEQSTSENNQNSAPYKYFDFFSLLTIPESEQQKYESLQKDLVEKDPAPDVISLD